MQNHSDGLTAKQKNSASADWRQVVQRLLKGEMSKRGVKYQDLSERLVTIGVNQSADNLRNKINKGILGADLLLQIMFVLNMRRIERDDIVDMFSDMGQDLPQ
ncbi:DUF6471 domain-containing protein [Paraglaciecola polaris]|uniref:GMP synthase, PP-ATPase domain/subunit i n=1 Tax=Paraglaciecola polaris LMG 21857 TaxID=1129793 RepID=K6ZDW8_9ALTE|nr:DUF6471 domain-containing protein [Paraglaciecola polaris]GAC34271.1 GMP synthase, PP-ATPase domain/subunit i [Paraglaciecola polaris LMG 21857]|tara:strand:+ start:32218 stop:32526 length:309 start_codon:yes stop_codon:yes gene_type:complete